MPSALSTVPVSFQPGTPERNRLIHAAVDGLSGPAAAPVMPIITAAPANTAPVVPAAPAPSK